MNESFMGRNVTRNSPAEFEDPTKGVRDTLSDYSRKIIGAFKSAGDVVSKPLAAERKSYTMPPERQKKLDEVHKKQGRVR